MSSWLGSLTYVLAVEGESRGSTVESMARSVILSCIDTIAMYIMTTYLYIYILYIQCIFIIQEGKKWLVLMMSTARYHTVSTPLRDHLATRSNNVMISILQCE